MSELRIDLPPAAVDVIAERAAAIVLERLAAECTPASSSPYLTIPEAAELLRCKRQRVDDLLSQGRLTRYKDGDRTLVSRAEIEAMLTGDSVRRVAPALPPDRQTRVRRRLSA